MFIHHEKIDNAIKMTIEMEVKSSIETVWDWLATNDGFAKWFPELRICDANTPSTKHIQFVMDDFIEDLAVIHYHPIFEICYEWSQAKVCFTLEATATGTQVVFIEEMPSHFGSEAQDKYRDMAGWATHLERLEMSWNHEEVATIEALFPKWENYMLNITQ